MFKLVNVCSRRFIKLYMSGFILYLHLCRIGFHGGMEIYPVHCKQFKFQNGVKSM